MDTSTLMNIPQKKYFCKRIDEISTQAINKLQLSDNNSPTLTDIRVKALTSGKVTFQSEKAQIRAIVASFEKSPYWNNDSWGSVQVLSLISPKQALSLDNKFRRDEEKIRIEVQKEINKISVEATRIKDEAMLGSASEAQKMLAEFIRWVK